MKELKDYLHLYLGCEVMTNEGKGKLISVGFNNKVLDIKISVDGDSECIEWFKLVIHPLSDMTEMEIIKLMTIIYKSIFGQCGLISETNLITDENDNDKVGFTCKDDSNNRIGVTVEVDRGIEFSFNEDKLKVNQFECTQWLLKNSFDLFGLIEAGLAIDKTTLK